MENFTKAALRDHFLALRQSLSYTQVEAMSQVLVKQLLTHFQVETWQGGVHIFLPIAAQREFNTLLLYEALSSVAPQLSWAVPKINDKALQTCLWDKDTAMTTNRWGIAEPSEPVDFPVEQLAAVIVPMLCFDLQGHRVGYGGGFYDRFLATCLPRTLRIGVCFFEPLPQIGEINPHDIALHYCLSPNHFWDFTRK